LFEAGAVTFAQPSVTKLGGGTEFLKGAALADAQGGRGGPRSPSSAPRRAAAVPSAGRARGRALRILLFVAGRQALRHHARSGPRRARSPERTGARGRSRSRSDPAVPRRLKW